MGRHQGLAETLLTRRDELALRIAGKHLEQHPWFLQRFGEAGRARCIEDAAFHLLYLSHALQLETPALFTAYAQWARQLLEKRRIPWSDLQRNLELLRDELGHDLDAAGAEAVAEYVGAALAAEAIESDSFLANTPREPLARAYLSALLAADRRTAASIIADAARTGVSIRDLYQNVFVPVQREIGRLWQNNELSVAEEHYCTASTQAIMAGFYPQILTTPRIGRKAVVACVGNELHEIGARMVADFFEMEGWDGIYLGANTPAAPLIELVCRERPHVVVLSVTMTYHLGAMAKLVERMRSDDRCGHVKILVGGYVFQQHADLWRTLGVDGCAADAAEAVVLGNEFVNGSRSRR